MTEKWQDRVGVSEIGGRVRCEPGWTLDRSWCDRLVDFDLWLVWSGQGTMRLTSGVVPLRAGTCVWMRPGGLYTAIQNPEHRLGVSFMHFHLSGLTDFTPPFELTEVRSLDFVVAGMTEVIRWKDRDPVLASRLLGNILGILARDHAELIGAGTRPQTSAHLRRERTIRTLAAQIMEEPGQKWSVAGLAQRAGMAPDHFSRVFGEIMGARPQAFVVRNRINRAQQLLLETHLQVGEIAQLLGFRDVFYFSRQFRGRCGVSPSHYRREPGRFARAQLESSA